MNNEYAKLTVNGSFELLADLIGGLATAAITCEDKALAKDLATAILVITSQATKSMEGVFGLDQDKIFNANNLAFDGAPEREINKAIEQYNKK